MQDPGLHFTQAGAPPHGAHDPRSGRPPPMPTQLLEGGFQLRGQRVPLGLQQQQGMVMDMELGQDMESPGAIKYESRSLLPTPPLLLE